MPRQVRRKRPAVIFNRPPWVAPILFGVLVVLQAILSWSLVGHLYFNDDHEQIARAAFFDDLYLTQFSVHMPVPAVISHFYLGVAGFTHEANRGLAAVLNILVILGVFKMANLFSGGGRVWPGFIAGVLWITLENDIWAFLNVSQLYSAAFFYVGIAFALRGRGKDATSGVEMVRPVVLGFFWVLAIFSRVMIVEQIFVSIVFMWLLGCRPGGTWRRYFGGVVAGGVIACAVIFPLFLDRLDRLVFWTLIHNFDAKSGRSFNPYAWIGDIGNPVVRDIYIRLALIWGVVAFSCFVIRRNLFDDGRRCRFLWVFVFLGGWLAANPSGIGETFMQAIPAFPAVCIAFGVALSGIFRAINLRVLFERMSSRSSSKGLAFSLVALIAAGGAILNVGALERWYLHFKSRDASAQLHVTQRRADYIRQITGPEDRIFVFGTDPLIYAASGRRSATPASILYGDLGRYEGDILRSLKASMPAVVLFDASDAWFASNIKSFPRVVAFLLDNYVAGDVDSVLVRKGLEHFLDRPAILQSRILLEINDSLRLRGAGGGYCFVDHLILRIDSVDPYLSFDGEDRWSEVIFPVDVRLDRGSVLKIRSKNSFGGWLASPGRNLRVLLKSSDERKSWGWFSGAHMTGDNEVEVVMESFRDGAPFDYGSRVVEIQVGGWGNKSAPIVLGDVTIGRRKLASDCK